MSHPFKNKFSKLRSYITPYRIHSNRNLELRELDECDENLQITDELNKSAGKLHSLNKKFSLQSKHSEENLLQESKSLECLSTINIDKIWLEKFKEDNNEPQELDIGNQILEEIVNSVTDEINSNSINTISVANNKEMTSQNSITEIFNNLKIPDAVKDLPNFDGNPRLLFDFIENVEEILRLLPASIDGTSYATIIIRAIRNKIVGEANEILNMYGTPLVWKNIKENLISHYADKRNETSLIQDLHALRQGNETVEKFYSKVIEILSTITNHVKINELNPEVIKSKQTLYQEMCLNIFLSRLKEPLGCTIRAMRPSTLAEAFSYCLKEQNTYYVRNSQQTNTSKSTRPPGPKPLRYNVPNHYSQPLPKPTFTNTYHQPQRFNFAQTRPNHPFTQQLNTQRYNNNHTHNTNRNLPEPMDTSSGNTSLKPIRFGAANNRSPAPPPRFVSEELFK